MPVLKCTKHEQFALFVVKGVSATKAYVSAGYSPKGAQQSATRLLQNAAVCARIKELKTAVAERVVSAEIRHRNWRVQVLQQRVEAMLALSAARAEMYRAEVGEAQTVTVNDLAEERAALQEGFSLNAEIRQPDHTNTTDVYPRVLWRGGAPNGGATGMLVKDYRGKNAEQVIRKFDAALESKIFEALKQAAIEEGQWTEKRETKDTVGLSVFMQRLNAGRDRVAADKRAREGK
jgi:phage terminase small subunit